MITLLKTTIKLLLRNKGFLFFLLVTPIVSSLILNLKTDFSIYQEKTTGNIIELKDKAIYDANDNTFIIKVYDGAKTELSEYVLGTLAQNGMFSVCRSDVTSETYDEILDKAKTDAFNDRAGVILYINNDFDSAVMNDSISDGTEIFDVSDDQRKELFEYEYKKILSEVYRAGSVCNKDVSKTIEILNEISENIPEKKVTDLAGKDEIELTPKQTNSKVQIGYAFAIITLGFMFSGVFAAHTVITEDNNKVYTRIMMSGTSTIKYFVSKFSAVILMCLLQTGVLAICLCFMHSLELGISKPLFLLIIFLLGIIFSTFSMLTGIIFGDIMSSNYAAFTIWSISDMLAGVLFPIGDSSSFLKTLSYLMPQRWFMDASERLIAGVSGAVPILAAATASYLILTISIGSVGLMLKKQET